MAAFTLAELASRFGGRVAGDSRVLIRQVGTLQHAGEGEIAFLANPRYRARVAATRAAAVILAPEHEALTGRPRIVCENPYAYFARVSLLLNPVAPVAPGIHATSQVAPGAVVAPSARVDAGAVIEQGAEVAEHAWIGAGCYVGVGTKIAEDCRLHPTVVVYHGCRIGARSVLHSGAVIGADGFGIARDGERWIKVPQTGGVRIGEDVEIGAGTTIDRGAIDDTVIEDGVKLDNQIQIGHNCRIGAHTAIAGCVGIAGSTVIGRHCAIGGAAMIIGHLEICDRTEISAGTLITRSIREPGTYTGVYPFERNKSWARNAALVRHLAELAERVHALEQRLSGKEPRHG